MRRFFIAIFSMLAVLYSDAHADVTLYRDINYRGNSAKYGVGRHNYSEIRFRPGNDVVSSIKIDPGCIVTIYWDSNYRGRSLRLTKDTPNLVDYGFNDQLSSMIVEKINVGNQVRVWQEREYSGFAQNFSGQDNTGVIHGSVFVPKGYSLILYSGENYSGSAIAFEARDGDIWVNDLISIFPVVKSRMAEKLS